MGLHWTTAYERPLPLLAVDRLRSARELPDRARDLAGEIRMAMASAFTGPTLQPARRPVLVAHPGLLVSRRPVSAGVWRRTLTT